MKNDWNRKEWDECKNSKAETVFPKKNTGESCNFHLKPFLPWFGERNKTCQRRQFWSKNFHPETTCNYLHICNRIANIRVPKNIEKNSTNVGNRNVQSSNCFKGGNG